jgi:hypothetical protein
LTRQVTEEDVQRLKRKLDPYDERMIQLLMEYQIQHGDCHIPTGTSATARQERKSMGVSEELAAWVVKQRKMYRRTMASKKENIAISDRVSIKVIILESLGFMWSCREAQWQRNFNRLERYRQHNGGSVRVTKHEDPQLWHWMDHQRKTHRRGKLSSDKEGLLRELGFVFDPQVAAWWNYFERLLDYKDRHGDTLVPVTSGDLGSWVARQRSNHNDGQLEGYRIDALNEIGFSWKAQEDSWEKNYEELCKFYEEYGHTRVPRSAGPFWNWVDRQRRHVKEISRRKRQKQHDTSQESNGTTDEMLLDEASLRKLLELGLGADDDIANDESRTKRLLDLTFEIALHDEKWIKSFRELRAFKDKYGHFSVHGKYKELSAWVRHQRYLYHKGGLSESRISLLDSIGFEWTAEEARWNRMYEELLLFHQQNGHARIPVKNAGLYRWTKQQKRKLLASKPPPKSSDDVQQRLLALQELLLD